MRILFMGTAEIACPSLEKLASLTGHEVVGVITQPDRPSGRKLLPAPPPVKVTAQKLRLPVHQPARMREPEAVRLARSLTPDLIVVIAYGQILPGEILEIPACGCVNVHTSLLPRWRGAAPIQYAILNGDAETGVTTMYINERMDEGDIILQQREPIYPDDTAGTLHDRLSVLGANLLVETVRRIGAGEPPRTPQDPARVTYAKKISKEDGRIDWTLPAAVIERQVRAYNPWPSAYTFLGELMLKVWRAEVLTTISGEPGRLRDKLTVCAGQGSLRLLEVQPAGGKRMTSDAFLRGHKLQDGARFV
jgi:methionyl-tRNA formyltransferase